MLDEIDRKFSIKLMEEGDENKLQIDQEKKFRIEEIDYKFTEVIDMLVQSYTRNSEIPDPSSLPIKVTVQLVSKGMEFRDVVMKQYDSMNDIKRYIERKFEEKNNSIEEWCNDIEIIIRGPLANLHKAEEVKNEWDIDDGMDPDLVLGKTTKVDNMMTTKDKLNIENGSTIEIFGTIK